MGRRAGTRPSSLVEIWDWVGDTVAKTRGGNKQMKKAFLSVDK